MTIKQWKVQQLAERMLNLSVNIAAESARQIVARQRFSHEQAIIAEEARFTAQRLLGATERNLFGGLLDDEYDKIIREMTRRTSFMALNTAFVSCKIPELAPVAVHAEELLNLWRELCNAMEAAQAYSDIPMPLPRSRVIPGDFYLLRATSGSLTWCENAQLVSEVMSYSPDFIMGNRLVIKNDWRDMDMPYINLGEPPGNPGIVIISDALDKKKQYAVYAEVSVHGLVNSHVGVNSPYSGEIPVRECWVASDGSEMIFPDWEKLAD